MSDPWAEAMTAIRRFSEVARQWVADAPGQVERETGLTGVVIELLPIGAYEATGRRPDGTFVAARGEGILDAAQALVERANRTPVL